MRRQTIIGLLLVLLTGCAVPAPLPPLPFPPDIGRVSGLALPRITWDKGNRPDVFCEPDIGDAIHRQMRRKAAQRGYRVVRMTVPRLDNSYAPDPVAAWPAEQLLAATPSGADMVMRVRVTEYLDASLCDNSRQGTSLDMTAVAEIFARGRHEPVWQVTGRCSILGGNTAETVWLCVAELTDALVSRLPPPP
ncbi:hypothetical protein EDC39_10143 [Geothermobacter ehrlichii]|uniref:Lipoprotein n=1 Tax=Geothermobacter ehrlichii TaxID=213224 RepID=A0A5D3WNH3_9BACT|nr:hypothetical protein [Geothermobacter ehrlichii]TYO99883.1 hypothetical protein EDC39_10143 [Geothermobacter ehrlichii]